MTIYDMEKEAQNNVTAWIEEYILQINKLFDNCITNNEDELASYVLAMGQLLNSVANMTNTNLYRYEQRILFDSLQIFIRFFIEQIDSAIIEKDVENKVKIHQDVSDSVQRIMIVYRNVIGSMMNADNQVATNFTIDTNLYQLSPKLTAFYSDILSSLKKIYSVEEDKEEYSNHAFLLYPSLKSLTQSYKLFGCREKAGAVVIIYLSECLMETIDTVPIVLMHEAFHFLGQIERQRLLRAKCLQAVLHDYIFERMLDGFSNETKEIIFLTDSYLRTIELEVSTEINSYAENDKALYGNKICSQLAMQYEDGLWEMLGDDLTAFLLEKRDLSEKPYSTKLRELNKLKEQVQRLKSNIVFILKNRIIEDSVKHFMEMFREVYADVLMVLICKVTAEQYDHVFEDTVLINTSRANQRTDYDRIIRQLYVSNTITTFLRNFVEEGDKELAASWERYYEKNREMLKKGQIRYIEEKADDSKKASKLYITHSIYRDKAFERYFTRCAEKAYNKLQSIDKTDLSRFRRNFKMLLCKEKDLILMGIYSGARFDNISSICEMMVSGKSDNK